MLDVLKIHPSAEGLQLAAILKNRRKLKSAAMSAAMVIAKEVSGKGVDVSKLTAAAQLDEVKLQVVSGKYGAGSITKDVTTVLPQRAGDLPLITLPAKN